MEYTDIELKNEKWKDIFGYDGMYQVSDLGRVRSRKSGEWKVMKHRKMKNGYLRVDLYKDKNVKTFYVHRLVESAFILNSDENKTQINHIDECKHNNRVSNLEYCTASYNLSYNGLRYRRHHTKPKRDKIKELYDPNLTYNENLEIFKANGMSCSKWIVKHLRRDIGLINPK